MISDIRQPKDLRAHREAIFNIVRQIPEGRVMTYGRIAAMIPPPSGVDFSGYSRIRARWVGYALKRCPDDVPWHRVINAQGRISSRHGLGPALQRALLEAEGIAFDRRGRMELASVIWDPASWPSSSD